MRHTIKPTHDHTTGRTLYVVLTPDGFDATGEGFETIGEALRAALCLDTERETEALLTAPLPNIGDIIEMPHANYPFVVCEMWVDGGQVRAVLCDLDRRGNARRGGEVVETLYCYAHGHGDKGLQIWQARTK